MKKKEEQRSVNNSVLIWKCNHQDKRAQITRTRDIVKSFSVHKTGQRQVDSRQCEALIRSAAFSATPYKVANRWALICIGITEASTTRTLVVSYTLS